MRVHCQVLLPCSVDLVWNELQKTSLFFEVARPWFTFASTETFPERWSEGDHIEVRSRLFGLIPCGVRSLSFDLIDHKSRFWQTRETDGIVQQWDHHVRVEEVSPNTALFIDEIEIKAGLLTLPIIIFAYLFYRHRQRQWRKVATRIAASTKQPNQSCHCAHTSEVVSACPIISNRKQSRRQLQCDLFVTSSTMESLL